MNFEHTIFESLNNDGPMAIIHLHQKLQNLQDEVMTKLSSLHAEETKEIVIQKKKLSLLACEVARAIQGISPIVYLTSTSL